MQVHATIPLEITVTHYHPADPGQISGPPERCYPPEDAEIEFEVRTLTGHELSESDFDSTCWDELHTEVLGTYEELLSEARDEARIDAWEDRKLWREENF